MMIEGSFTQVVNVTSALEASAKESLCYQNITEMRNIEGLRHDLLNWLLTVLLSVNARNLVAFPESQKDSKYFSICALYIS